jgi:hypothetical protein
MHDDKGNSYGDRDSGAMPAGGNHMVWVFMEWCHAAHAWHHGPGAAVVECVGSSEGTMLRETALEIGCW